MPYFIDIKCSTCQSNFRIDAENYINKKISFNCKNCGNKVSYFVPPGIQGLSAPKAEIATKKVKKVKEELPKPKKEKQPETVENDSASVTDKLKIKLPSLFKRKREEDEQLQKPAESVMAAPTNQPVIPPAQTPQYQPPVAEPAQNFNASLSAGRIDNRIDIPNIPAVGQNRDVTNTAGVPEIPSLTDKINRQYNDQQEPIRKPVMDKQSKTPGAGLDQAFLGDKSLVYIPKPGMPFIAQLSTPTFYKAGSAKRKDYSFIVAELSRFRTTVGRVGTSNPLSVYKTSIPEPVSEEQFEEPVHEEKLMEPEPVIEERFAEPEPIPLEDTIASLPDAPFAVKKQPEPPIHIPQIPVSETMPQLPSRADIEREEMEFQRSIKEEQQKGYQQQVDNEPAKMEYAVPVSQPSAPEKPKADKKDSKIFLPLNLGSINTSERPAVLDIKEMEVSIETDDEEIITPEFEVVEDSHSGVGLPSASSPPLYQNMTPQAAPFTPPPSVSAPQFAPQQQPDFIPQQPFPQAGAQPSMPPFMRENPQPLTPDFSNQQQPFEIPPDLQQQTATQRMPAYIPGQANNPQGGISPFPAANGNGFQPQPFNQVPDIQPSQNIHIFSKPVMNNQSVNTPNPIPQVPSSIPQPQAPVTQPPVPGFQNPPQPVPPPSVASPKPVTGGQKKPAVLDEDEEEQFGPSNFGLDF